MRIGLDPVLVRLGAVTLTWDGLFTLLAVGVGGLWCLRTARRQGLSREGLLMVGSWAVVGGVVGARALGVAEHWGYFRQYPGQVLGLWDGALSWYGALLGGTLGLWASARVARLPFGALADLLAPGVALGHAVGRLGDLLVGRSIGTLTGAPWGVVYTHPDSPVALFYSTAPTPAVHPVALYEGLGSLLLFGALVRAEGRLAPPGSLYALFLFLYAFLRYFLSFYRVDAPLVAGLNLGHLLSLGVLAVALPWVAYRTRWAPPEGRTSST